MNIGKKRINAKSIPITSQKIRRAYGEAHSELCQISKMVRFANIVNGS